MMNKQFPLYLTDSKAGKKVLFTPANNDATSLYVCGVTPYDHAHIGHGRSFIAFDVLFRVLRLWGYAPTYVRNITDIDDKIVAKAQAEGIDPLSIAQRYTDSFHYDMTTLGLTAPTHEPKVSEYMPEIIAFIERLIACGAAYEAAGDVYFAVDAYASYGSLSGRVLDEQVAGARGTAHEQKKNPMDFALWKGGVEGSLWDSPWGKGRPGWHIECSTFVHELFGKTIDIHGGGIDLLFPHHENEQAQAEACYPYDYARYWVHNAHVMVNKEKMSKSLGNARSLKELMDEYHPMVFKLYVLQHHYKSPMDIDYAVLQGTARAYRRLVRALAGADAKLGALTNEQLLRDAEQFPLIARMCKALADDVHTPRMLATLFGELDAVAADPACAAAVRRLCQGGLGLSCESLPEAEVKASSDIEALIAEREAARAARDWKRADAIRDELARLGHSVVDKKLS